MFVYGGLKIPVISDAIGCVETNILCNPREQRTVDVLQVLLQPTDMSYLGSQLWNVCHRMYYMILNPRPQCELIQVAVPGLRVTKGRRQRLGPRAKAKQKASSDGPRSAAAQPTTLGPATPRSPACLSICRCSCAAQGRTEMSRSCVDRACAVTLHPSRAVMDEKT